MASNAIIIYDKVAVDGMLKARLDLVIISLPECSGITTAHILSSWRGCLFF